VIRLTGTTSALIMGRVSVEMTIVTTTFLCLARFKIQLWAFTWVSLITRMLKADWAKIVATTISWDLISSQFPLSSFMMYLFTADSLSEIS